MHRTAGLPVYQGLRRLRKQMIKYFVIVSCVIFLGCNLQPSNRRLTVTNTRTAMDWKVLNEESQLKDIINLSETRTQVIFKHSIRCSISAVAKSRLDRFNAPAGVDFYYLDLIRYRNISSKISEIFRVHHESPQVLVIRNGECVYDESHMGINFDEIIEHATR